MIQRQVRFTATARRQLLQLKVWWRENMDHPQIVDDDLAEAILLLAGAPGLGSRYRASPIPDLRRFYLSRLTCHLYYTYDERGVEIRAVWHARRGAGPVLG